MDVEGEYWCTDCGAPRADEQPVPCSECGSTAIIRHLRVVDEAMGFDDNWGIAGQQSTVGVSRSWREKLTTLLLRFEELQQSYSGTAGRPPVDTWKSQVGEFFVEVHHLCDWLRWDTKVPPYVANDAGRLIRADPDLALAVDFSNSYKHHTRDRGGRQVEIGDFECSPSRNCAQVVWTDTQSGAPRFVDARDLASACMLAWRTFLSGHGLL